jgi:hypothetical protein
MMIAYFLSLAPGDFEAPIGIRGESRNRRIVDCCLYTNSHAKHHK